MIAKKTNGNSKIFPMNETNCGMIWMNGNLSCVLLAAWRYLFLPDCMIVQLRLF